MEILTIIIFALALNMDAFAAGTAYGMRGIKIPPISVLIISLMSVAAISISMLAGKLISQYVPVYLAHALGGGILFLIGAYIIYQTYRSSTNIKRGSKKKTDPVLQIHIRPLGLIAQVIHEPTRADMDQSGNISPVETLLLGTALCVDAFLAGFAVSMLGFDILLTALIVGVGHLLLFSSGILFGRFLNNSSVGSKISIIPGLILSK